MVRTSSFADVIGPDSARQICTHRGRSTSGPPSTLSIEVKRGEHGSRTWNSSQPSMYPGPGTQAAAATPVGVIVHETPTAGCASSNTIACRPATDPDRASSCPFEVSTFLRFDGWLAPTPPPPPAAADDPASGLPPTDNEAVAAIFNGTARGAAITGWMLDVAAVGSREARNNFALALALPAAVEPDADAEADAGIDAAAAGSSCGFFGRAGGRKNFDLWPIEVFDAATAGFDLRAVICSPVPSSWGSGSGSGLAAPAAVGLTANGLVVGLGEGGTMISVESRGSTAAIAFDELFDERIRAFSALPLPLPASLPPPDCSLGVGGVFSVSSFTSLRRCFCGVDEKVSAEYRDPFPNPR